MAHDGQDMLRADVALLPDLLALAEAAVPAAEAIFDAAKARVKETVSEGGKVSAKKMDANQTATHGLAWLATYVESLRQMHAWASRLQEQGRFGEVEKLLLQIGFGEYLAQIKGGILMNQGEIVRLRDLGLSASETAALDIAAIETLIEAGNSQTARIRLVQLMQERNADITVGATGLDEELEMIREQFRRYALDKVEPFAHEWHLKDELIPMEVIDELAEMGVFGLTIPEEFGGLGLTKASMVVV